MSVMIVVVFPSGRVPADGGQALEDLDGQEPVAQSSLEALGETVLPRTARLDAQRLDVHLGQPQRRIAAAMNSGPLSLRMCRGMPRDGWLADWETQSILDDHDRHPLEGYRRLAFTMLDGDVVAAFAAHDNHARLHSALGYMHVSRQAGMT